jgi:DNA-binding NtrC family response regulator
MDMSASTGNHSVLVVDGEENAQALSEALRAAGYSVESATGSPRVRRLLREREFGVVVCDAEAAGVDPIAAFAGLDRAPAWIQLSGFGSVEDAVEAVRRGASDYLCKPCTDEQILVAVARALEQRALRDENKVLKERLDERFELGNVLSRDEKVHKILQSVEAVADTRATILIEGESGTGKTLLARTIHQRSARRAGPFVEVNCGALPDNLLESELFGHARGAFTGAVREKAGKFEAADGGTIFLDEIGTATPDLQIKLLRILQDRAFERVGETRTRTTDARVIAATNERLEEAVRAGRFREDLYWRLRVIAFEIPPLRERPADVPLLAARFVERFAREHARGAKVLAPDALARLVAHRWPGNVRELEHCLERAVLLSTGDTIGAGDLGLSDLGRGISPTAPLRAGGGAGTADGTGSAGTGARETGSDARLAAFVPGVPLREALEAPERAIIEAALMHCDGNRKETARLLDVNRTTLFNKMKKYKLMESKPGPE